uniref:Uncharacterized protein n=1 Tax=Ignisphaera aggregans TaxID=334771 RepID=A0A7J3Z8I3_9CREN
MGAKMRRVWNVVKWYVKSGLFHLVVAILLVITALGFYNTLEAYRDAMKYTMVYTVFELTLFPLYVLSTGLHLVRSSSVIIFEVNMFKDWRSIFLGKLASFVLSWIPLLLITCLTAYITSEYRLIAPLVVRFIVYTSLFASAILLKSQRAALLYFITMFIIMPLSAPIVLNGAVQAHGKIDATLSLFFYFTSPISMINYENYADIPMLKGFIATIGISALIMVVSMEIFRKLEYALESAH